MRSKLINLGFRFNQFGIGYNSKYKIRVILESTPYKMVGGGNLVEFNNYEEFEKQYNKLRSSNCGNCG